MSVEPLVRRLPAAGIQPAPLTTSVWRKITTAVKSAFNRLGDIFLAPLDRILKVTVYRMAINDRFSSVIKAIFFFFAGCGGRFKRFDRRVADASLQRLGDLGAEIALLDVVGGGQIQAMRFTAASLQLKITALGAEWKRDENQFVIEGPNKESGHFFQWVELAKKLNSFRWGVEVFNEKAERWECAIQRNRATGKLDEADFRTVAEKHKFRFVTCKDADCIPVDALPKEILFNHDYVVFDDRVLEAVWVSFGR